MRYDTFVHIFAKYWQIKMISLANKVRPISICIGVQSYRLTLEKSV